MHVAQSAECQLDLLVRRYAHRVKFFANKVDRNFRLGARWNDDLISAGYWGLFKALRNRRPEAHEQELSAYVSIRIHGAIIDAARHCINRVLNRELEVGTPGEDESWRETEVNCESIWPTGAWLASPEEGTSRRWKRSAVRRALDRLQPEQRRVILSYMDGASLNEIARDEGVATATMQVRFSKLSRQLRVQAPELRRILLDC